MSRKECRGDCVVGVEADGDVREKDRRRNCCGSKIFRGSLGAGRKAPWCQGVFRVFVG